MCQSIIPADHRGPDMSHIESAYQTVSIELYSSTARKLFERRFDHVQIRLYKLLVQLPCRRAIGIEKQIKEELKKSDEILNSALVEAKDKLASVGVLDVVINRSALRVLNVKVFSACARRFLELLGKLDQMMLYLELMFRHELISNQEMVQAEKQAKAAVQRVDYFMLTLHDEAVERNQKRKTTES